MHAITLAKALNKECSKLKDAVMISGLSYNHISVKKEKLKLEFLKLLSF
jgi:hypothetical protein